MSQLHLYKFGGFELLVGEGALRRDGADVPITPKMSEMLVVLVREHGKIVSKEKLLSEVWPDSYVEEGNITYNIRQLRKALGDDAQSPIFIETIPRRGYRFIADVEEVPQASELPVDDPETPDNNPPTGLLDQSGSRIWLKAAIGIVLAVFAGSAWFFLNRRVVTGPPILSSEFASEKLSTNGTVFTAAISPDGQNIVYSDRRGSKQGLWLRKLSTSTNVEIVPTSEGVYYDVTFSPDGNTVYYSRGSESGDGKIDVYRVATLGGIPEKLISNTEGWISISTDGLKLSFVRCPHTNEEYCSLWVASTSDFNDQKKLASRPAPIRIGDNEISPDGSTVAFAVGQSRNQASEFGVMEIGVDGSGEREFSAERFFNIKSLAWLPDRSGLLATASRIPNKAFRIWKIMAGGSAEPLTKDSGTYAGLGIDRSGSTLVATEVEQDFHAYRVFFDGSLPRKQLSDASNGTVGPDGTIVFSSIRSGNDEIWSMNADGSAQRQLTNDPADDRLPIVSPDGKAVYFSSNRTGKVQVWRMRMDGSDQRQITQKEGGMPLFATPDGKSLYYRNAISGRLWVISLENGDERPILDRGRSRFGFTPDGSTVAFLDDTGSKLVLAAASTADGHIVRTFDLPPGTLDILEIGWLASARSFLYVTSQGIGQANILFMQSFDGGQPSKLLDLGVDEISEVPGLGLAPDGKSFILVTGGWKHDAVLIKGLK